MGNHNIDFEFLVATARRSIEQQQVAVYRPGPGPVGTDPRGKALADHVIATLSAIERRMRHSETRLAAATTDAEREAAVGTMRLLNQFLAQMHEAGPWLEAVETSDLHIGSLYFIDAAAAALVGPTCDVLVASDATYGYSTISWPFEPILQRLGQSVAGVRPIVVFSPPEEMPSLLLHGLFVHELGHPAVVEHNLLEAVLAATAADPAFDVAFQDACSDFAVRFGTDPTEATFIVDRRLRRWLTELLCDALATAYLGPSYLLAFAAIVAARSAAEIPKNHPPTSFRLRLTLDQLAGHDWDDELERRMPRVAAWLHDVADMDPSFVVPHAQFLLDSCVQLAPTVHALAASHLGVSLFTPSTYKAGGEEVEDLLRLRILPAQLRDQTAPDRRTILFAGWTHVLSDEGGEGNEGDSPASLPLGLANDDLQGFLAKSFEMSAILEGWHSL